MVVGRPLGLPRAQVVTGVIGIVVGIALGILAAWIAHKQKQMQEEQHQFFCEQRDNKPSLELWVTGMQQTGPITTRLTFSIRNAGKAAADGFAWEIVLPFEAMQFAAFRTEDGHVKPFKITTDFVQQAHINFFKKDVHRGALFVGDMVDVAWITVAGAAFSPFQIQWRIYAGYGTVPEVGHKTISVAPRPEGLLDVRPVLSIPAVTTS